MKIRKRCVSLVLILTTMSLLFTGCGKKNNDDSAVGQVARSSKDYVFSTEMLDVGQKEGENISRIGYAGNRVYVTENNYESGTLKVYSFNADGSDARTTEIQADKNSNFSYATYGSDGSVYVNYYVYHWDEYEDGDGIVRPLDETDAETTEGEEGTSEDGAEADNQSGNDSSEGTETTDETDAAEKKVADENESGSDSEEDPGMMGEEPEDEAYLCKYDKDGNLVYKVDLVKEFVDDDYSYISVSSLLVTDNDELLISMDQGIFRYDEKSGFKVLVDNRKNNDYRSYKLIKGFGGKTFVSYYGENGIALCTIDVNTGEFGNESTVFSSFSEYYNFFGGNGYDLYASDRTAIYGYDLATDTKTKLLDYVDSDLEMNSSSDQFVAISDTEFVAVIEGADMDFYLAHLTKVPPEQVVDRQIITLGGYYIDYDVRRQAFDFNKKNSQYKIKFVDYSSYDTEENYNAGIEKMNMDIVSGDTPDILLLSTMMPIDSYVNKGLFYDLSANFKNDPDTANTEFLTTVIDAFRTNGKLYKIVPTFNIGTMIVKTKYTDGKDTLTLDDCKRLIKEKNVNKLYAFGLMTREEFLEKGIIYASDSYIDWENKQCHFDNDAFVDFLEFTKDFPETYPDGAWDGYSDSIYLRDEALFSFYDIYGFNGYAYRKDVQFGEPISFVGYPNEMGENNSILNPTLQLAVSAQSKHIDACWDFVKSFLLEEYQDKVDYNFPIRKSSFDKLAEKAKQRPYNMEDGKKVEYDESYYVDGQMVIAHPLTSEDVLYITNFIKSLTKVKSYNENVNKIIFEEASAFYSGQKTAKEVADIIQSRLSIYVNENS